METKYKFKPNTIYCDDNIKVLLDFPSESVNLIYIDPPFFTSKKWEVIWGDEQEKRMFEDVWKVGIRTYKSWMRKRIKQLWRILKPTGSFYLHCDYHANAHLRIICDEIFGTKNFKNEIIWRRSRPKGNSKGFCNNTDTILYYTKSKICTFNPQYGKLSISTLKRYNKEDENGKYMERTITAPGSNNIWDFGIGETLPVIGRGYAWNKEKIQKAINNNILFKSSTGRLVLKVYLTESKGVPIDNLWNDIHHVQGNERYGYPTQKPEKLLERIIKISSNPTDIVLDSFCGCGTTLAVATKLGRQFIGIDSSHTACMLMAKRIKYPIGEIMGMPMSMTDIKKMKPFEFQNWACRRIGGDSNPKKTGDDGIDGWVKGVPIEVKQKKVGSPDVKKFITAIEKNSEFNKGFMVGFDFSDPAIEDQTWAREKKGMEIIFIKVLSLVK